MESCVFLSRVHCLVSLKIIKRKKTVLNVVEHQVV